MKIKIFFVTIILLFSTWFPLAASAWVRGLYITQSMLEHTRKIKYLIKRAKQVGINTFVIDFWTMNRRTRSNIALVKQAHLRYVARIVMFPYGALHSQVTSQKYLQKRYRRIMQAVSLGAQEIQLDYIRYRKTQRASSKNAHNIYKIIKQVHNLLRGKGVKLQIDIFGVAAHGESRHIGQNVPLFAHLLDAICPMVYPSHYEPFRYHARRPYQTVYESLVALRHQLKNFPDVKIYAYIELYNYRYWLSRQAKINYILAELRAVRDSHANGWYAWSANNKYNLFFSILAGHRSKLKPKPKAKPRSTTSKLSKTKSSSIANSSSITRKR